MTRAARSHADLAVARRAFRQVWISATVCAVAFGATAASSALTYVSSFPTAASRRQIAATTGHDRGLSILLGPTSAIGTVGGYTVYKVFAFLTIVGAIWAVLVTTRLLRGEEESGRWQLVLAGSTRPARVTLATLGALAAAVVVIFVGTTALTMLAGRDDAVGFGLGASVLFGLSIAIVPAVFVAIGAVTSQLTRTRRGANGIGIAVFGVAFALRMVADSASATRWLLWTTPFGWSELMRPFTRNDLRPLVAVGLAVVVLGAVAVVLSSRRDADDGLLASRDVAHLRPFGLGSAFGMTARRELPVLVAWCAGAVASGLMLGVIAKVTTGVASKSLNDALDKFDVHGTFAKQYLGVAFLMIATVVALVPASQVGAAGEEETSGRLVHVLTRTPSRVAWFVGRLGLCAAAIVVSGLLAGLATYAGVASQGLHLSFATMIGSGLNVVPPALVALGVGAVVLAIAPRVAAAAVYVFIVGSLVIDLSASFVTGLDWLRHLSLFHYMALVPAQRADASTVVATIAVALLLCAGATFLFRQRDLSLG